MQYQTAPATTSGEAHILLAGCYDQKERNEEILRKLDNGILRIQGMNLHKQHQQTKPETEVLLNQDKKATTFHRLQQELENLKKDISNFSGRQCTAEYRRLQERCVKLEIALDSLNVDGKEDLRSHRKSVLVEINTLSKNLFRQTHPDGVPCQECIS
ncbi:unnamed protein product [Orchesella dallaii]|uniref:BAG domain-containing protein n=1 Tax=Orchesella dallaii TaxID=48710 RepID=A0ABP1S7X7_9HEXA